MNLPRFNVSSLRFKVPVFARDPIRLGNLKLETLRQKPSRRRAFTLVEILATLGFLGLVIPVTLKAVQMASRAGEVSERSVIAAQLGENKLGELMLANAWTTAESRGTFSDDRPGYRWELKRNDWQSGAMTELDLDVFFPVRGHEESLRLSTLVNEQLVPPDGTGTGTGTSSSTGSGPSL